MHPTNRAERRHIRDVWRNYRRFIIFALWNHFSENALEEAMQNRGWVKGGKQYFACGNRCMHSMCERETNHMEVKKLRRERIEWDEENFEETTC